MGKKGNKVQDNELWYKIPYLDNELPDKEWTTYNNTYTKEKKEAEETNLDRVKKKNGETTEKMEDIL